MKFTIKSLLLLMVSILCGCSQDYTITGVIDGSIDGDSVILGYSANGTDFTVTDKTVVNNGKFHFSGSTKNSSIYYIRYEQSIEPAHLLFFLEGGNINIEMSANDGIATGTPSNDLNTSVEKQIMRYVGNMLNAEYRLQSDTLMSDSTKAYLNNIVSENRRDAMLYIKDVIVNNMQSIVSLYLLVQYYDLFTKNELEDLIEQIPAENINRKNNCIYDVLIENLNNVKTNKIEEPTYEW